MNWRPRFGRLLRQHSLRHRYLGVAIFLGIVVIASAALTQRYVSTTSEASARNLEARNQIQQLSRTVRNAVWGAEYALQSYILAPAPWHRETVESNLTNAARDIASLRKLEWIRANQLQDVVTGVAGNVDTLSHAAAKLMDIRSDVNRLFPSAALMDNQLSPANASFQTAIRLALDELAAERDPAKSESYQTFENARHTWLQLIGAFRLYVVRSAGIYGNTEQGLEDAGHDIQLLLGQTNQHLQRLTQLDRAGKLDLQASESLRQLREALRSWHLGFEEFRQTQRVGHWRNDIPLIQEVVQPLFAAIWNRLDSIDVQLETGAVQDVSTWTEVGRNLNRNLLLLSLLATTFICLGFVFFQRTVLKPLTELTRAMKTMATSEPQARLPRANSIEACDLIEAFVQMRRSIREREMALRHQALHDALTGLPNRVLIKDRLQQAILAAERGGDTSFCLLMIDLDRFKEINDTLGHQAGDQVLREVSVRLTRILRKSDTVARLGGDEFAILLPHTGLRQAQEIAQFAAATIEQPLCIEDRELPIGGSIGISAYPDHGRDAETLFKHADVAMYVAKQNQIPYSVYNVQQDRHSIGRLALISELRTAIHDNELILHYQPKLDMISGAVIGVEALLRWPKWKAVPMEYLISASEKTSLIKPLTLWVLQHALRQMAQWRQRGIQIPVSVNLSTWNLAQSDIHDTLQKLLLEFGIPPEQMELEITENAMMKNPEQAHGILDKLHALGVKLTVDDYGTGFSSLAYLKTMPIDQIKIDKSFVIDMLEDEDDAVIVRSTIDLAHNLGMKVVAEGVSSIDTWNLLEILGCDSAQGYFIAHPMSAENLEIWLMNDQRTEFYCSGHRA